MIVAVVHSHAIIRIFNAKNASAIRVRVKNDRFRSAYLKYAAFGSVQHNIAVCVKAVISVFAAVVIKCKRVDAFGQFNILLTELIHVECKL